MLVLNYIITNGYIDISTLEKKKENGWKWVASVPAKNSHPHALDTDWMNIFSKYEENVLTKDDEATQNN